MHGTRIFQTIPLTDETLLAPSSWKDGATNRVLPSYLETFKISISKRMRLLSNLIHVFLNLIIKLLILLDLMLSFL
jgi:hypothetical protein